MPIELLKTIDDVLPDLEGQTILLLGEISPARDELIQKYIINGLEKTQASLIVSFTKSMQDIIDEISKKDIDAGMLINEAILNENFYVIDSFSYRVGKDEEEAPGVLHLEMPDDLTTLSIYMNEISQNKPALRTLILPFSLLVLYNKISNMLGFTQTLVARTRFRKQTTLLVIDEGVLTHQQYSAFKSIVDSIVEIKVEDIATNPKYYLRVPFTRSGYVQLNWELFAQQT